MAYAPIVYKLKRGYTEINVNGKSTNCIGLGLVSTGDGPTHKLEYNWQGLLAQVTVN